MLFADVLESADEFWAICTDHKTLEFMFYPYTSLSKNSSAMIHRLSVALSAYRYTIEHRSAKDIQHADFLVRRLSKYYLFIQQISLNRVRFTQNTRTLNP